MLQLTRPLVFLDLETTGLDRENDRIVSIALYKVYSFRKLNVPTGGADTPSGLPYDSTIWKMNLNPGIPIPEAATAIHGITDADVADCPFFAAVAVEIQLFLSGCDIAGFGSNYYDVPLLYNEFQRASIFWQPGHLIDVGNIFKINEPRSLTAAMRFYTGRELKDGHTAVGDALATLEVFAAQMGRYDLPGTVEELAIYSNHGNRRADISGKFYYDPENCARFGFGPHKDQPALNHPDYLNWMYNRANFPADTNVVLRGLLDLAYELDGRSGDEDDDLPY